LQFFSISLCVPPPHILQTIKSLLAPLCRGEV
jgi:hypothetical protein